jgi:antirestriction protein ArdC
MKNILNARPLCYRIINHLNKSLMSTKIDVFQKITDVIIKSLEKAETIQFKKPWIDIEAMGIAKNGLTNDPYNGINQLVLSIVAEEMGYAQNCWLTMRQVKELKGKVLKGSKATPIVYWNFLFLDPVTGKKYKRHQLNSLPQNILDRLSTSGFGKQFHVFNVAQTENLPAEFYELDTNQKAKLTDWEKNEKAENAISNTGADIQIIPSAHAFYNKHKDIIVLPQREQFEGAEPFYKIAFHELGHWTGHRSRLNRELSPDREKYAFEELVAELTSVFMASRLGFNSDMTRNIAYLQNWLIALKNDRKFIVYAAQKANKASEFLIELIQKNSISKNKAG